MNGPSDHLQSAIGYIDLGMFEEANDELEELSPVLKASDEVLALRIEIYQRLAKWESARVLAESLARKCPDNPDWWISWAYAQRRETSVADAQAVLLTAATLIRNVAMIPYNLACYACVLGDLDQARDWLGAAFNMDTTCRRLALDDPDLEPLWLDLGKTPANPIP